MVTKALGTNKTLVVLKTTRETFSYRNFLDESSLVGRNLSSRSLTDSDRVDFVLMTASSGDGQT